MHKNTTAPAPIRQVSIDEYLRKTSKITIRRQRKCDFDRIKTEGNAHLKGCCSICGAADQRVYILNRKKICSPCYTQKEYELIKKEGL
jgi:hypothetical protein